MLSSGFHVAFSNKWFPVLTLLLSGWGPLVKLGPSSEPQFPLLKDNTKPEMCSGEECDHEVGLPLRPGRGSPAHSWRNFDQVISLFSASVSSTSNNPSSPALVIHFLVDFGSLCILSSSGTKGVRRISNPKPQETSIF